MKLDQQTSAASAAIDIEQTALAYREAYMNQKSQESTVRTAGAEALSLKVDHKRVKADDVDALVVLQQMEYQEIVTPYYSIVVTDKGI